MRALNFLYITALTAICSSCSTTDNGGKVPRLTQILRDTTGQNGRACVRTNDIDGYGTLKYDVVSIDGHRKYYLATLMPGCNALDTSVSALFNGKFGEVCGGAIDKIAAGGDHCVIHQMFEFENREEAFATYDTAVAKRQEIRDSLKKQE